MRTGRVGMTVAGFCGTAVLLSACAGNTEQPAEEAVAETAAVSTSKTTGNVPAGTGETADTTVVGPWENRVDPQRFAAADGGYLVRLTGGDVCSIGGGLGDAEFSCLLNFDEPMTTEDGTPTRGIEFHDGMFTPSAALADADVVTQFEQADAELLQPGESVEMDRFTIIVETADEVMFLRDEGVAQFFIAAQGHTPFWTPRPEWIPLPEYLLSIDEDW